MAISLIRPSNPFFRVPFMSQIIDASLSKLLRNYVFMVRASRILRTFIRIPLRAYDFFFASPILRHLLGERYLEKFMYEYLGDITRSPQHTANYLRLFQELNAHSVYHLLRHIEQPTLIVSGLLDVLTPAYNSFDMARCLPHAVHCVCPTASHAAILESPERVLAEIVKLLAVPLSSPAKTLIAQKVE
jgi:pimeloyl-ACP methyl ester carboxylesterase